MTEHLAIQFSEILRSEKIFEILSSSTSRDLDGSCSRYLGVWRPSGLQRHWFCSRRKQQWVKQKNRETEKNSYRGRDRDSCRGEITDPEMSVGVECRGANRRDSRHKVVINHQMSYTLVSIYTPFDIITHCEPRVSLVRL